MTTRKIAYIPLADIARAPVNPRDHEVEEIAASIERFGFADAPVHDGRTGRIIAGHGRLEALQWLHDHARPRPDGIRGPKWEVPVQHGWSSTDDAEAEALLVGLNRLTEVARWRTPELAELLERTQGTTLGLAGIGYTPPDLDLLLASLAPPAGSPEDEWVGMPEFEQSAIGSKYATTIHFATMEDAERFWTEVLEGKPQRSTWWPKHDGHVGSDVTTAYVADPS